MVQTPTATRPYHDHIDGLRAIAILLVLLYHFDLAGVSRGFLGVDVFFVISGFLVGGLVFSEIDRGQFRLAAFYRRRIARLLPALVLVSTTTLLIGWLILLPDDYVRTASSIRAAAALVANHHFHKRMDYFAPQSTETHFLHSWSLSVEEQFYLIVPFAALLLSRWPQRRSMLLLAGLAFSLVLNAYLLARPSSGAFYFMPARAWELLAGVWLASEMGQGRRAPIRGAAMSFAGLVLLVSAVFVPQSINLWLGFSVQVAAVIGTFCLLSANLHNPGHFAARLLALKPMRFLGRMSYSLYLIHWPLLTLSAYWAVVPLSWGARAGLAVLAIVLAWGSLRWIEDPVRNWANSSRLSTTKIFALAAMTIFLLGAATTVIVKNLGVPGRFDQRALQLAADTKDVGNGRERCHSVQGFRPVPPRQACLFGKQDVLPDVAVWGDSHGVELSEALGEALVPQRRAVMQLTSSSCPPVLDARFEFIAGCQDHNQSVLSALEAASSVKLVLLIMRHDGYKEISASATASGLRQTAARLTAMGKTVVIVGPLPAPEYNVPVGLARRSAFKSEQIPVALPLEKHLEATAAKLALLNVQAVVPRIRVFDPTSLFCGAGQCAYALDGESLFFDNNHPSMAGARLLVHGLMPLLSRPEEGR